MNQKTDQTKTQNESNAQTNDTTTTVSWKEKFNQDLEKEEKMATKEDVRQNGKRIHYSSTDKRNYYLYAWFSSFRSMEYISQKIIFVLS